MLFSRFWTRFCRRAWCDGTFSTTLTTRLKSQTWSPRSRTSCSCCFCVGMRCGCRTAGLFSARRICAGCFRNGRGRTLYGCTNTGCCTRCWGTRSRRGRTRFCTAGLFGTSNGTAIGGCWRGSRMSGRTRGRCRGRATCCCRGTTFRTGGTSRSTRCRCFCCFACAFLTFRFWFLSLFGTLACRRRCRSSRAGGAKTCGTRLSLRIVCRCGCKTTTRFCRARSFTSGRGTCGGLPRSRSGSSFTGRCRACCCGSRRFRSRFRFFRPTSLSGCRRAIRSCFSGATCVWKFRWTTCKTFCCGMLPTCRRFGRCSCRRSSGGGARWNGGFTFRRRSWGWR